MTREEMKALDAENVMQTYARFDVAIDRGKGATLYSPEGAEYIDFTSGIGVNSLGCADEKWALAIYEQALKLQHISNLYYTEPGTRLSAELTRRTGMKNVFFANSGAEANEGMIKLARKYSRDKYGKGRSVIITLNRSFHGRTVTTLAATGQDALHKHFFPFTEGFKHVDANDAEAFKNSLTDDVCAIMLELIQGEGGVLPLDEEYVKELAEICRERDILFLIDEIQTGAGRCASLFLFEQYDISPDVISFAKGIGGGLPIGGFIASEKCSAVMSPGDHGSTFGANPIAAAGALEVLNRLTDELFVEIAKKGKYIEYVISTWNNPKIGKMRGRGLMLGLPIENPKDYAKKCAERGLLILTAGSDALRLLPPLNISYDEINKGLTILKDVCKA